MVVIKGRIEVSESALGRGFEGANPGKDKKLSKAGATELFVVEGGGN